MSTRATTHFQRQNKTQAIIYRHPDGYPEGLGQDLKDFFQELKTDVRDPRFEDPAYLAAKWVVRDAQRYARHLVHVGDTMDYEPTHPLEFLSVGVTMEDPSDIEFRYIVDCDHRDKKGLPLLYVEGVRYSGEGIERRLIK